MADAIEPSNSYLAARLGVATFVTWLHQSKTSTEHAYYDKMAHMIYPTYLQYKVHTHKYVTVKISKIIVPLHCVQRNGVDLYSKIRGQDSIELDVEMRKKEERLTNGLFFERLVLTCLMNDLGLARCTICWRFWFWHLESPVNLSMNVISSK